MPYRDDTPAQSIGTQRTAGAGVRIAAGRLRSSYGSSRRCRYRSVALHRRRRREGANAGTTSGDSRSPERDPTRRRQGSRSARRAPGRPTPLLPQRPLPASSSAAEYLPDRSSKPLPHTFITAYYSLLPQRDGPLNAGRPILSTAIRAGPLSSPGSEPS
jgi:hypothetical protein